MWAIVIRFALASLLTIVGGPQSFASNPETPKPRDPVTAPFVIDDFETAVQWSAHPSDGVELKIGSDTGRNGRAMRLDFDFQRHAGYAIVRRTVDLSLPANYEITFSLRADAPVNDLELKLVDASGDNVWWMNRRAFGYAGDWREIVTKKRQVSFAWGPAGGGEMKHVAAIEIAITAGTGGKGTVWIDDMALRPLPAAMPPPPAVTGVPWRGVPGERAFTFDMGDVRELGGLRIDWDAREYASEYDVELSRDGVEYAVVRRVARGNGGRDWIWLPDSSARSVRITMRNGPAPRYAIRDLVVEPVTWAATINDFFAAIARSDDARRGDYPRYLIGEQAYWTIAGADGGQEEALVGEDGAVEPFKSGFSIEPFIHANGRLLSWADVTIGHSLEQGYLPIPSVTWNEGHAVTDVPVSLQVTSVVTRDAVLYIRYRVASTAPITAKLYLAIRPFQVNPSSQFLNTVGGASSIRQLSWSDGSVVVNGQPRVTPLTAPRAFGAKSFDEGNIVDDLRAGLVPGRTAIDDAFGYASGALSFDVALDGASAKDVTIAVALNSGASVAREAPFASIAADWREKLTRVAIDLPAAPAIADTIRSSIAWMLINRDGPALQPGSRSYERAWIRDGALMAPALLRLGHADVVREFAEWYAPYQFKDGKVPCCVDHRGADPVPENDSHGELIFLIAEYYRYTGDVTLVRRLWAHIDSAARYIDALRMQRKGAEYQTGAKRAFYGLLPESISHEGYSAKPVHSYWDDFFALAGLQDAAFLAALMNDATRASELRASATDFRTDLAASIRATIAQHNIDYVPGSADLGDFDPSATSIGIAPLGLAALLPHPQLERTFERYLTEFRARRDGRLAWDVYTPYEMRMIDAFVQRGEREHAHELLHFFMADRRPAAWNQWAEVVPREKRSPHFLGDIPHAWIASDFVRAALDMFAFDSAEGTLVIGAGIPGAWVKNQRLHVGPLRTYSGTIDVAMQGEARRTVVELSGTATRPISVRSPDARPVRRAIVNGRRVPHTDDRVAVRRLPARIIFEF